MNLNQSSNLDSSSDQAQSRPKAVIASVGGSPDPILYTLRQLKPDHVWYFCSEGSRSVADDIHEQITKDSDWNPDKDFIEVTQFEELGPCYKELRSQIPQLLKKWHVSANEVIVDYTGGTKTMSAALVLAGVETFKQFSYIGGHQREKEGLGITMWGQEKAFYQDNPWNELSVRDVERASDLWKNQQFDAAAELLIQAAQRVDRPLLFQSIAQLATAMAARHRLDFNTAIKKIKPCDNTMPALFDGRDDHGLISFIKHTRALCGKCIGDKKNKKAPGIHLLHEILDNSLRTASEERYADAAARLYRAMEMQAQLWIKTATNGLFKKGRCTEKNIKKIPSVLKEQPFCQPTHRGDIRLGLEPIFFCLELLPLDKLSQSDQKHIQNICSDLKKENEKNENISHLRTATENRNKSLLAHGTNPVSKENFETMKAIASDLFGFDLTQETNPIIPFDMRWFD